MPVEGLEHYSNDQLIEELINRSTFAGLVIFQRSDAKNGRLEPGETVMTTSPPLSRQGVEYLLQLGQSLVTGVSGAEAAAQGPAEPLPLPVEPPPLRVDEGGAVRVGKSRVSLDLVVEQYQNGVAPEDMVRAYDTLTLADVHAVIGYYLRHRDEVLAYLTRRAEEAAALRARIEAESPRVSREELLARRAALEQDHAPAGQ
jgi:uncharacterized protein (DUF433 family)